MFRESRLQPDGYLARDLFLHAEDVGDLAVVLPAPDVSSIAGVDQFCDYLHTVAPKYNSAGHLSALGDLKVISLRSVLP